MFLRDRAGTILEVGDQVAYVRTYRFSKKETTLNLGVIDKIKWFADYNTNYETSHPKVRLVTQGLYGTGVKLVWLNRMDRIVKVNG
jgi:hypothetical protein